MDKTFHPSKRSQRSQPDPEAMPSMESTREVKAVGIMTEGVGVSRKKPKESRLKKIGKYLKADAEKTRQGDIWGPSRANGYG